VETLQKILAVLMGSMLVAACSAPKGENWPTISFGAEIEAINEARAAPSQITLAPLPALSDEDRAGSGDGEEFFKRIEGDFAGITKALDDRRADYKVARAGLDMVSGNEFLDTWLVAQMELSNISQNTEALKIIRAQVALLGDPLPAAAEVLLEHAEALELENRRFVAAEKLYLSLRVPGALG